MRIGLSLLCMLLSGLISGQNSSYLERVIKRVPTYKKFIAQAADSFELQVIFKPLTGQDSGTVHRYGVDGERYFYPASTVKLPAAVLTLQWINEQGIEGLDKDARCYFSDGAEVQFPEDPPASKTSDDHRQAWQPSLGNFITDAMLVSDNMAYNRLFELIGPHYINRELHQRGWRTRIIHRVGVSAYSQEFRNILPALRIEAKGSATTSTVYMRARAFAQTPYEVATKAERKGVGYYDDGLEQVVHQPFDFSQKNFLSLEALAEILQAVVAPTTLSPHQRFNLSEAQRSFLCKQLSTRPAASPNPAHHEHEDGYVNFLYYGGQGAWKVDGPVIYNKVGDAYGYLTEAAVFEDRKGEHRYLLAATIHVNRNRIYNDGNYEYEEIGLPFLAELGRAIWADFVGE